MNVANRLATDKKRMDRKEYAKALRAHFKSSGADHKPATKLVLLQTPCHNSPPDPRRRDAFDHHVDASGKPRSVGPGERRR